MGRFVVFSLLLIASGIATGRELTLQEALNLAKKHNPDLISVMHNLDSAKARKDQALSQYFPIITGSLSYQRQTGNFTPRPGLIPSQFHIETSPSAETFNYYNFSLNLQQTIYDFGRTQYSNQVAKEQVSAASKDLETVEQDVWFRVTTAYFQVLAGQEMVEVAKRNEEQARRNEEKALTLVETGMRSRIDALRAKADLLGAKSALLKALDSLKIAKINLLQAIGLKEQMDFVCVKETLEVESFASLEDAIEEALGQRSDVVAMRARISAQHALSRLYRSNFFPSLGFAFSFTDAGVKIQDVVWNFSLGVVLNVPIFNGLLPLYQMREAKAQALLMQEKLRGMELDIRKGIESAFSTYQDAKAMLEPLRAQVEVAKEALSLAEARYESGAGSYIELLDATTAYANAEADLVRAELDVNIAFAGLLRACGRGRL
jgi:outer membrane protein TolC